MKSSNRFSLRLFGTPYIETAEGALVTGAAVQRHRLALLALLALAGVRGLSRDKLLGYLWPESPQERARQLLNQAVYHLRKVLGEQAFISAGDELRLNTVVIDVDVAGFEDALEKDDPGRAVALYRGAFMDGFYLRDAPEFEDWAGRERERLGGVYAKALETLAHNAEGGGDHPAAAEWWKARAAQDPYDSRVALRLMQALEDAGNRAGALQHAAAHARLLEAEFGIRPPAEVQTLAERLRQQASWGEPASRREHETGHAAGGPPSVAVPAAGGEGDGAGSGERNESDVDHAADRSGPGGDAHDADRNAVRPARAGYVITAVAAAALGAASLWYLGRDSDAQWLLNEAVPTIEAYLDVADWESAYAIARQAERRMPGAAELDELWTRISWRVSIESDPPGATVYRQAYMAPEDTWEQLGRTPLVDIRIPYGLSRLRFELEGYRPLLRALGGAHINWAELAAPLHPDLLLVGPETYKLDTPESLPADKVRVPGGPLTIGSDVLQLNDFLLGRHEVTNAEFKAFVDAGGYRRPELWDAIVVKADTLGWADAVAGFVDQTGRPGPSTWEAGDYPQGQADFPVSGVSWYEAAAYARFMGQELPTAHHWQQALANAMFPWLLPASNFSGEHARPVTESRATSHVGAFDLAGNVREWTSTAIGAERIILGGSWNDPYYIAGTTDTSAPPEDRSAGNGIRLAITEDHPEVAARLREPFAARTTAAPVVERQPVSDDVYAAYSRVFDYDRTPLDAAIEAVDTTRVWIRERVRFAAAYGAETMLLHLYLPANGTGPYQTVVYWPGWDTFSLDDPDQYFAKQLDFIVKSGRAVAFPVYKGIFERRVGNTRRRPEFGTAEYRDNTIDTVKDLRRTIDYLETRAEIDAGAIAFFGYSWGGVNGPSALAQEPRMRVAVICIGLLPGMAATPEVDPVNALPRVRIPTLMFSGEFDAMVPTQNALRYFALIGTPPEQKRHVIAIGGHFVPRQLVIRETLDWLDRYLGRANAETVAGESGK